MWSKKDRKIHIKMSSFSMNSMWKCHGDPTQNDNLEIMDRFTYYVKIEKRIKLHIELNNINTNLIENQVNDLISRPPLAVKRMPRNL